MQHDKVLILDFGSQVTQLIARRVRDASVYCEIHPNDVSDDFIKSYAPKAIILSGSHASTYEDHELRAPQARAQRRKAAKTMRHRTPCQSESSGWVRRRGRTASTVCLSRGTTARAATSGTL